MTRKNAEKYFKPQLSHVVLIANTKDRLRSPKEKIATQRRNARVFQRGTFGKQTHLSVALPKQSQRIPGVISRRGLRY
jgi:transposase